MIDSECLQPSIAGRSTEVQHSVAGNRAEPTAQLMVDEALKLLVRAVHGARRKKKMILGDREKKLKEEYGNLL